MVPAWVAAALFIVPLGGCSSKSDETKQPVLQGASPTNLKPQGGEKGPRSKGPVSKD
jgi:hypothetical protein